MNTAFITLLVFYKKPAQNTTRCFLQIEINEDDNRHNKL